MPFHLTVSPCDAYKLAITMTQSESNRLIINSQYSAAANIAGGIFRLHWTVTYPQAGTVALSIDPTWVRGGSACNLQLYGTLQLTEFHVFLVFGEPGKTYFIRGVETGRCPPIEYVPWPTNDSFQVTAGQTVSFEYAFLDAGGSWGSGEIATIVFTPVP
jgi:hypothetical protein